MPIYLADPKKFGTKRADGSRYTDYNRTRPSAMLFVCTMTGCLPPQLLLGGTGYFAIILITKLIFPLSMMQNVRLMFPLF